MSDNPGRPLPKFGEWDVNDPTTAEGYTVIFNKARDDKKAGATGPDSPGKEPAYNQVPQATTAKPTCRHCGKRILGEMMVRS